MRGSAWRFASAVAREARRRYGLPVSQELEMTRHIAAFRFAGGFSAALAVSTGVSLAPVSAEGGL